MKGAKTSRRRGEVKITDEQNNQFAYQNFQSRSRLDARLWLECRYALVKSMMAKVSGMGLTKGTIYFPCTYISLYYLYLYKLYYIYYFIIYIILYILCYMLHHIVIEYNVCVTDRCGQCF